MLEAPNFSRGRLTRHVWRARLSFLAGDVLNAAYQAGWALHNIQDRCVGKGLLGLKHETVEDGAANVQVRRENVQYALSTAESSLRFVKAVLYSLRTSSLEACTTVERNL